MRPKVNLAQALALARELTLKDLLKQPGVASNIKEQRVLKGSIDFSPLVGVILLVCKPDCRFGCSADRR